LEVSAFYARQGRGRFCHVDNYLRQDPARHCYFTYPEDHASTDLGFNEAGEWERRHRKSAFEIIFVYRPEDGILEISAKGGKKVVEPLAAIFCKTILGLDDLPEDDTRPLFDLSVLQDRDFDFERDPEDGIESVCVRELTIEMPGGGNRYVGLDAPASPEAPHAVYDLISDALDEKKVSMEDVRISLAKLQFTFASRDGKKPKTLTFTIYPKRVTLKDQPLHQVAKKYLKRWEIARA